MLLGSYLRLTEAQSTSLGQGFDVVAEGHGDEPDVSEICRLFADTSREHAAALGRVADRYESGSSGQMTVSDADRCVRLQGARTGPLGLLLDLHDLHEMGSSVDLSWTLLAQAAQGLRDSELLETVRRCEKETATQLSWLTTRAKQSAPQALIVA